jgi:hypothetical protein
VVIVIGIEIGLLGAGDQQQLARSGGVAPVGLAELPFLRLNEDHLVAAVLAQHVDEPVV